MASTFTEDELKALELLKAAGQQHILDGWPPEGEETEKKKKLLQQVLKLDGDYPGGIVAYVQNARRLLRESLEGTNPFEGCRPLVPHGARLDTASKEFLENEDLGMSEMDGACFVLVAGGLGERLGYSGIKLELPAETTTNTCFLALYAQSILALQHRARVATGKPALCLPLAIMTSGDTHAKTLALLDTHAWFGMRGQITLVKQELVPAMTDNDGRFALSDPFTIETKPHGHGDVHFLLHSKGLVDQWVSEGRRWVFFLQDTNGLVFRALPAALGVSKRNGFAVNSIAVPRRPGEAVGGIVRLERPDGRSVTVNVEYNQLGPLLAASGMSGDTADESGFSPYPGNINVLVFALGGYHRTLHRTQGAVPEFVNPKYSDGTRTRFSKPTRLECMMQDYPRLLVDDEKVGVTQMDRWLAFSAVKNNVKDALAKLKATGVAESASSAEADMYYAARKLLSLAGVPIDVAGHKEVYAGLPTDVGARVVLRPSFACTLSELKTRVPSPAAIAVSARSSLVVEGPVVLQGLVLDGALAITAAEGARVTVAGLRVDNKGDSFRPLAPGEVVPEPYAIRGYVLERSEQVTYYFGPGEHSLP